MYTIYHNPHCSKSRAVSALLRENDIEPNVVEYMKEPLVKLQLSGLLRKLCLNPRELLRTSERDYKTLGLSNENLNDDYLLDTMIRHPKLIERPIVVRGEKAVIGRPAEEIFKLVK